MRYKEVGSFLGSVRKKKKRKMLNSWSLFVSEIFQEGNRLKASLVVYNWLTHQWDISSTNEKEKKMITPFLVPPPPLFLFYCTWMLLTELCLFTPIGFSTVHAQVSVNINYFYQDLQCAEWLAKRVYCKRQMKMRESKVTWMLNF